jgi:hypothetical protein
MLPTHLFPIDPARPTVRRHRSLLLRTVAMLGAMAACGEPPSVDPTPPLAGPEPPAETETVYTREYHFLGLTDSGPVAAALSFSASPRDTLLYRTSRGWLARGEEWNRFLDNRWSTSRVGGVWRILPHENVTVLAGGQEEVEALTFERGDRSLRLYPGQAVSTWERREEHRLTIRRGALEIAMQPVSGFVVESLLVEAPGSPLRMPGVTYDRAVLTDGEQRIFVLGDGSGDEGAKQLGWGIVAGVEQSWHAVELQWLHVRPEPQARRDVPLHWTLRIGDADVEGEIISLGYDLELGPDHGARRSVEMQHTVEGWISMAGDQIHLFGVLRHVQR